MKSARGAKSAIGMNWIMLMRKSAKKRGGAGVEKRAESAKKGGGWKGAGSARALYRVVELNFNLGNEQVLKAPYRRKLSDDRCWRRRRGYEWRWITRIKVIFKQGARSAVRDGVRDAGKDGVVITQVEMASKTRVKMALENAGKRWRLKERV